MPLARWIMHVDMDAFFASVEQLDNPDLCGKPVLVGGQERGVVAAASYEARAFGVRSAMPLFEAKQCCPTAIVVPPRMGRYKEKSQEIMAVLQKFSPLVEPASIDEAYLDLTGLEHIAPCLHTLGQEIIQAVQAATNLSCSVGIAPVKFLAKIASDMRKPRGLTLLLPQDIPTFMQTLPVGHIPGVGRQTLDILAAIGVTVAADVLRFPLDFWQRKLGKAGGTLYERAQGLDTRGVTPYTLPQSESAENTFPKNTLDTQELSAWLLRQAERVGAGLRNKKLAGRTITLKVKYADFTQITRSITLNSPTNSTRLIYQSACELLKSLAPTRPLRLIGLGVSHFGRAEGQLSLLPNPTEQAQAHDTLVDTALDKVRSKYGLYAIGRGHTAQKISKE